MKYLVLLVCLCPGLASAGTLYRCVGAGGQVSYQAKPCAAGQRIDRTIEFAAVPADGDDQPRKTLQCNWRAQFAWFTPCWHQCASQAGSMPAGEGKA